MALDPENRTRVLKEVRFPADRKQIELRLCENNRGQFLQIVESKMGRRDMVVIPESGFVEFLQNTSSLFSQTKL